MAWITRSNSASNLSWSDFQALKSAMLREVMSGKIPDEVRWCRGKPHLGWLFNDAVTRRALDRGDMTLAGLQMDLKDYVDTSSLTEAWQRFVSGGEAAPIHTANILSIWLRETAKRPVVPDRFIG